ncbi:acyl-CoA N-acyltransferase [Pholiota molesta]|nr:acyl-CoA N-acyltransferase [Pholiota molesta]
MESSPLLNKGNQARVRSFQDSDTARIHEIYLQAMVYGLNSPAHVALNSQLRKPLAIALYVMFAAGLVLLPYPPPARIAGAVLSITTLAMFIAWRQIIWSKFKTFCQEAVRTDLADIKKHYGTSPSGFWVAEIAEGSLAGTIIGCVGLDSTANEDPSTAELQRMVVDPMYQNHGVGRLLMTTLVEHAKASGLSTISLSTSMYQPGAMCMYERFGFIKGKRVWVTVKFIFTIDKAYLQFFTLNL